MQWDLTFHLYIVVGPNSICARVHFFSNSKENNLQVQTGLSGKSGFCGSEGFVNANFEKGS